MANLVRLYSVKDPSAYVLYFRITPEATQLTTADNSLKLSLRIYIGLYDRWYDKDNMHEFLHITEEGYHQFITNLQRPNFDWHRLSPDLYSLIFNDLEGISRFYKLLVNKRRQMRIIDG
jgi:hypothetical protein